MMNDPYRILFIVTQRCLPTAGGVERSTLSLAQSLIKKGHYVAVLYTSRIDISDASVCPLDEYSMPADKPYCYDEKAVGYYRSLITDEGFNVVVFQNAVTDRRLFFLENTPKGILRIANVNVEATHRIYRSTKLAEYDFRSLKSAAWWAAWHIAPHIARGLSTKLLAKHYRRLAECADCIVFRADAHRKAAITLSAIDSTLTAVIPNSYSFDEKDISTPLDDKDKIILFVGRLVAYKQPMHFVKAWQQLLINHPDWHALIIGNGPEKTAIESYIKNHGIERIALVGRANPLPYYRKASIIVLTSATEGFGNVIVEGMALGCVPVAYSSAEAMPEVITDGTGLISDPNPEALAQCIDSIISSPEHLAAISRAARDRAEAFSPDIIADRWLSLFGKLSH